jgi:hypothetical protein
MPKSALLDSFCVSPSRPAQSDDANIIFVHGSLERKSQKGRDANADRDVNNQELKNGAMRKSARDLVLLECLNS